VLRKDFDMIDPAKARVILIEGNGRVLTAFPPELSEKAERQLQQLGVEVRTQTRVKDIRAGEVDLGTEIIRAGSIIWAAGVSATPITSKLGVEIDRGGRVKVAPDASLPGHPNVFAIGDMAALVDANGVAVPGVSPSAIQMGQYVAGLIAAELKVKHGVPGAKPAERKPFVYRDKGMMATIGRSKAVAMLGKWRFSGYFAWLTWLFVHLVFLVGLRNKFSVFFQWAYSYFTFRRGARIITGLSGERSAGSA
jgi:NADH:quinone reductase (non-electrogenic)